MEVLRSELFETETKKPKLNATDYKMVSMFDSVEGFYFDDFPDLSDDLIGTESFSFGSLRSSFDTSAIKVQENLEESSKPMDVDGEDDEYLAKEQEEVIEELDEGAGEMFPAQPGNFRLRDLHGHLEEYSHRLTTMWGRKVSEDGAEDVVAIKAKLIQDIEEVQSVLATVVLAVEDVFSGWWLMGKFEILLSKCDLYTNALKTEAHPNTFVKFVWTDQPLAKSFKNKNRARASNKNKMAHVNMKATIILSPGYSFSPSGPATARFYTGDEESSVQLQNDVEPVRNGVCEMGLRFSAGTRNQPQEVRLTVTGTLTNPDGQKAKVDILSESSRQFIVITNEVQFQRSEHHLLALELFPNKERTCSWAKFVNALQIRWMRVTRQEEASGINTALDRRMSRDDIVYFRDKYFKSAPQHVTQEQVKKFYTFFGKVSHIYRHNAGFRKMWLEGAVWGYICIKNSEAILLSEDPGTFLFRSSESDPGLFVISWVDQAGTVMHAKIPAKLLSTFSKLADYIGEKSALQKIHQPFSVGRSSQIMRTTNVNKDKVLKEFYSKDKTKDKKPSEGYVDLMDL